MRRRTIILLLAGTMIAGTMLASGCQTQAEMAADSAARVQADAADALALSRSGVYAMAPPAASAAPRVQKISTTRSFVVHTGTASVRAPQEAAPTVSAPPADEIVDSAAMLLIDGDIAETPSEPVPEAEVLAPEALPEIALVETSAEVPDSPPVVEAPDEVPLGAEQPPPERTTASPAPIAAAAILRRGMSGPAILSLQQHLAALGYLSAEPTGFFGRETESAVRAFQRRNSLVPDGLAGSSTMAVLLADTARSANTQ